LSNNVKTSKRGKKSHFQKKKGGVKKERGKKQALRQ